VAIKNANSVKMHFCSVRRQARCQTSSPRNCSHEALPFVEAPAKAKLAGSIEAQPGHHLAALSAFCVVDVSIIAARHKDVQREWVVFGFHRCKLGLDITDRRSESFQCILKACRPHYVQSNISALTVKRVIATGYIILSLLCGAQKRQDRPRVKCVASFYALSHVAVTILFADAAAAIAQEIESRQVVVQAEAGELPSAYGAPPDMSHGRISTLTKSYVLSPFSFELEAGYEGAVFRHGLPAELFRQEIEMGLPARFTVGIQNQFEHFAGETRDRSFSLEARYALANWNKLPLNPTISAEYRFGLRDAIQDSGELALLISHDFPHLVEWAMNIFVDREFGGRNSTSAGFAQSVEVPVLLPKEKLEIGLEMQYSGGGETIGPERTIKGFAIGPTLAWRPNKNVRFDLSPLIGASDHMPAVQVFALFSFSFGGSAAGEAETPTSTRGH
jgi:hypothetical protein